MSTAYPLKWPDGWPKTEPKERSHPQFKQSLESALTNLKREVGLLGGKGLVLSSNYTLGVANPKEPGVCAYFEYAGMQVAVPCDRWLRIEHNIHAIGLTLEAMRGMERWGAKHMIKAMFTGFKALPAPRAGLNWWDVFQVSRSADAAEVKKRWREACKTAHPDRGGNRDDWDIVERAYRDFCAERNISS